MGFISPWGFAFYLLCVERYANLVMRRVSKALYAFSGKPISDWRNPKITPFL